MKILAIETSCDETAIALVEADGGLNPPTGGPKFKIVKNLISSQIKIHRPFGGVVPFLAKREHLKNLPILFKKLKANTLKPDLLAVTVGPGLEPALWTGVNFAKEIQKKYFPKVKIIGANHLEGHLYSFLLTTHYKLQPKKIFPAIALIVSGGHTILLLMESLTKWKKIGETQDDAVGEAFDKVTKMLKLPYPGGPEIEKLAKIGNPDAINFPRPMINQKNYNFSFSGLKTSVLYYLKSENSPLRKVSRSPSEHGVPRERDERGRESSGRASRWTSETPSFREANLSDVAASFQKAAIDVLVTKTMRAAKEFKAKSIMLSGGVAANKALRKEFKTKLLTTNYPACADPPAKAKRRAGASAGRQLLTTNFNTDNAAIIGVAAYINFLNKKNRRLTANSNLNL